VKHNPLKARLVTLCYKKDVAISVDSGILCNMEKRYEKESQAAERFWFSDPSLKGPRDRKIRRFWGNPEWQKVVKGSHR
jgi:hypothetical protein